MSAIPFTVEDPWKAEGRVAATKIEVTGWTGATITITEAALIAEYGRRCGIGGGDR